METKRTTHESYGVITIATVQSSGSKVLFGSDVQPNNYIELSINTATLRDAGTHDTFFSEKEIVRVSMTKTQFAEFITSSNSVGTPCTLDYYGDKKSEPCPYETRLRRDRQELDRRFDERAEKIDELSGKILQATDKLSKMKQEEIKNLLTLLRIEVVQNTKGAVELVDEHLETAVSAAKQELKSFAENLGLNSENLNLLGYNE